MDILTNAEISRFSQLNLAGRLDAVAVAIDIKPGTFPNAINRGVMGLFRLPS
jgi:hypothetical protein